MSNVLSIAFPKRLADLKLSIYYLGKVEPPRELLMALDDVIHGGIKDMIPTDLFTLNVSNHRQQEDGFQSVDIILKLNRDQQAANWLEHNLDNWDSISKAFNGTFNYRRMAEITKHVEVNNANVIQLR